ncbi:MAG: DUF2167 domain-containing protein [Oceanospirillaceae bacterium]|nr:DUF2167 domain-containing protein [Oceanospirillaceae bacterium]MCP5349805.1 DUF2167 domain-containing protein [Oceanospirillaceae bacterium]
MTLKALFAALLLSVNLSALAAEPADSSATDATAQAEAAAQAEKYRAWATELWNSMQPQTGKIEIGSANASLNVSEAYYFLGQEDARKVLEDVWGNPPSDTVLGMIFPANTTPFDSDAWAVTVEYDEDGYVSDEDAKEIDYTSMLKDMQADTADASKEREKAGYGSVALIGWASQPFYDASSHKMHWAKEMNFGGSDTNTLNYNIRILGRKGVLVLNFIAGMDQVALIEAKRDDVLAMADFNEGARYDEFNPEIDKIAAYGIGALITGKVLAKVGFFAIALVFLKKFGVLLLVGLGYIGKKLWNRKKAATPVQTAEETVKTEEQKDKDAA